MEVSTNSDDTTYPLRFVSKPNVSREEKRSSHFASGLGVSTNYCRGSGLLMVSSTKQRFELWEVLPFRYIENGVPSSEKAIFSSNGSIFSMAQLNVKKKLNIGASPAPIPRIKIPKFDNNTLLAKCSEVLLSRCLNPAKQDVGTLIQKVSSHLEN